MSYENYKVKGVSQSDMQPFIERNEDGLVGNIIQENKDDGKACWSLSEPSRVMILPTRYVLMAKGCTNGSVSE